MKFAKLIRTVALSGLVALVSCNALAEDPPPVSKADSELIQMVLLTGRSVEGPSFMDEIAAIQKRGEWTSQQMRELLHKMIAKSTDETLIEHALLVLPYYGDKTSLAVVRERIFSKNQGIRNRSIETTIKLSDYSLDKFLLARLKDGTFTKKDRRAMMELLTAKIARKKATRGTSENGHLVDSVVTILSQEDDPFEIAWIDRELCQSHPAYRGSAKRRGLLEHGLKGVSAKKKPNRAETYLRSELETLGKGQ
jgi:hypothetical protein